MISILVAGLIAGLLSLVGTPVLMREFRARGLGQMVRQDGPSSHATKAGTPTMGGAAIVLAALLGYLGARLVGVRVTPVGLMVLFAFIGMAAVGLTDDFIKVRMRRNLGLSKTAKVVGQGVIAAVLAVAGPPLAGVPRNVSVVEGIDLSLPTVVFVLWVFLLLSGTSNAVNLTDGLDGLVAGSAMMVFGAYTIIAFWQFRHPADYAIPPGAALDLAVIAAATLAACAGFLWWNAPPAAIFMGDTGSLALGGLLAAMAIVTNTQVLLVLLGGLYLVETLSVIAQVASFRLFGRRVLRMAPLHHHFELGGWHETTVIVRFWIVAGIGVALGLGSFYAEFLGRVGTGG